MIRGCPTTSDKKAWDKQEFIDLFKQSEVIITILENIKNECAKNPNIAINDPELYIDFNKLDNLLTKHQTKNQNNTERYNKLTQQQNKKCVVF